MRATRRATSCAWSSPRSDSGRIVSAKLWRMSPGWPRHRRWETMAELDRLRDELTAWGEHRRDARPDIGGGDAHSQHEQHLQAVESEVGDALTAIRALADNTAAADAGALADAFAKIDRQVIWLRQAWHFFRTKLDQRDDPTLRPALLAADAISRAATSRSSARRPASPRRRRCPASSSTMRRPRCCTITSTSCRGRPTRAVCWTTTSIRCRSRSCGCRRRSCRRRGRWR